MGRLERQHDEIEALAREVSDYGKLRAISRHRKLLQFRYVCDDCWTNARHNTKTGKCTNCYPETPTGRPVEEGNERATARRQGQKTYLDYCGVHIVTAFSVAHGKCLTCYNSAGRPRLSWDTAKPLQDTPRAAARRARSKVYVGTCETHGEAAFSVSRGQCLTCFTMTGERRTRPIDTANARATARREGRREYLDICDRHGRHVHSVAHGKCLTCFTTSGVARVGPRL
jgi:hypothetical protein